MSYTFLAPVALGLMNVISLFLAKQLNLSRENRFLLISILAPTGVLAVIILFKMYNYTREKLAIHIVSLYIFYFVIWNLVVYNLDKYV
jgi:ATP/ADP translocase